jgi:hypothetical protein
MPRCAGSGSALLLALIAAAVPTAAAAPHTPSAPRVERISIAADGTQADGASTAASITPNGRYVAFHSAATNLTPDGGQRPRAYGYVRDLKTGEVTRVKDSMGAPVISDDGRYAAHIGWGTHTINVFLTDLSTGESKRIDGNGFKEGAYAPAISADGRYRDHSQCAGLQPGGEANLKIALTLAMGTDPRC